MEERFEETFEDYGGEYSSNIDAPRKMLKSFIQSEIGLAVAKREKEIAGDIVQIALDSWLEAQTLRMNVDGTATPEVDLEKMHKILLNKLITDNKVVKGKYTLIDDIPKWQNPDGTLEKYTHQDDNFSNECSFVYCRCRN